MMLKLFSVLLLGITHILAVPESKIVGGNRANDGDFPFIVSLQTLSGVHFCGGSILSENWVLSAAHCTINREDWFMLAVSGSVKLVGGASPNIHDVEKIINHENYRNGTFAYDVSVLRVFQPFVWSKTVAPIELNTNFIGGGVSATAMGWGYTTQNATGPVSNDLMYIGTTTITLDECRKRFAERNESHIILDQHLCSFSRIGQGICLGDSGGPIVINSKVVGIASGVVKCAVGYPDFWDRTSTFHSWILSKAVG